MLSAYRKSWLVMKQIEQDRFGEDSFFRQRASTDSDTESDVQMTESGTQADTDMLESD